MEVANLAIFLFSSSLKQMNLELMRKVGDEDLSQHLVYHVDDNLVLFYLLHKYMKIVMMEKGGLKLMRKVEGSGEELQDNTRSLEIERKEDHQILHGQSKIGRYGSNEVLQTQNWYGPLLSSRWSDHRINKSKIKFLYVGFDDDDDNDDEEGAKE